MLDVHNFRFNLVINAVCEGCKSEMSFLCSLASVGEFLNEEKSLLKLA